MNRTTWIFVIVGAVLVLALLAGTSFMGPLGMGRSFGLGWGMMGPWMGGGFGLPMIGGIMMLLFWGLVIVGAIWLVSTFTRSSGAGASTVPQIESPLDILKRRYAKGEITKEQFDEMRHALEQ